MKPVLSDDQEFFRATTARFLDELVPPAELRRLRDDPTGFGLDYWQQLPDGRVLLGGGRDVGGDAEWVRDRRWEAPTSDPVQAHLEHLLRRDIGTAAPVEQRWTGVVGFTDDALPVSDADRFLTGKQEIPVAKAASASLVVPPSGHILDIRTETARVAAY